MFKKNIVQLILKKILIRILELIRKINVHSVQKSMKNVDKKENFVEK